MADDNDDRRGLYSIRIIRSYIEYFEKFYHDIDIDEVLRHAGLTKAELSDDGYWCTQSQCDRFQEIIVRLTGNPHISREVGRFTVLTRAYRTVRQYTFGFITPATAYLVMPVIASKLSRGANMSARRLGWNRMEIISNPAPGVREKEYQCLNRLGHIEALAAGFSGKYAKVDHPACFHRGDRECRYIVSWSEPLFLKMRGLRNMLLIFSFVALGVFSFILTGHHIMLLAAVLFVLIACITIAEGYLEKAEYRKQVDDQAHTAELLMQESNMRFNDAKLIQEIGQAISSVLDVDTLLGRIMETLRNRLDFDRGAVLLADPGRSVLQYKAGYGFTPDQEEYLRESDILLDGRNSGVQAPFVETFREMKPRIMEHAGKGHEGLVQRGQDPLLLSEARSCICVPVVFEKQALGVLYVDRGGSVPPLSQSDQDRIMGIAPQIAISINNARTYERMEASESRYRGILEDMEESYYEVDLEGRLTFFNQSVARTYGYADDELPGMSFRDSMDEENIRKVYRAFHHVFLTGETIKGFEWKQRHKDGHDIYVEASISLRRDAQGSPIGFKGVTRDVTERKKAEEELRRSEERYRIVAENARDVIWVFDRDMGYTFVSPSVSLLRGYTAEEAMTQTLDQILTPGSYAKAVELLDREFSRERDGQKHGPEWSFTTDLEMVRKDGSTVWAEVTTNVLYDEEGNPRGFMGISRDITERRKAEEERKRLEDRLIQAQKMESIGTLAGGIAHDFNNLLTGILGNVSLALMGMDESDPLRERLKNVEEYVQRGSDLTKQLLGFARGGKYEVRPTSLGDFIRKSSEMFVRTKKEIHVHYKVQEGLWTVEVDRGQMEQVLMNLYVNAWQAMPNGGDLFLSAENVEPGEMEVGPHGVKPGRYVKLTVADNGVGMDEAVKARIFEPFFTTRERGRGTGLGLASVYGIIRNHGGFITVESEKGSGTSFMIHLPASDREVEDIEAPREEIRTGRETILLIDDEEMILDIGSRMLQRLGYRVLTAAGGRSGLEVFEKEHREVSLVVLDMIMPDCSGRETFDLLVRIDPSVRVLLSSGYSLDGQAEEIMQRGCRGFIQKPFTMTELSKKVRGVLDGQDIK